MPPLTVLAWIVAAQPLGRVGETPPMGFNPWNELARHYPPWGSGLNESDMLEVAHAMVSEHHSLAHLLSAPVLVCFVMQEHAHASTALPTKCSTRTPVCFVMRKCMLPLRHS